MTRLDPSGPLQSRSFKYVCQKFDTALCISDDLYTARNLHSGLFNFIVHREICFSAIQDQRFNHSSPPLSCIAKFRFCFERRASGSQKWLFSAAVAKLFGSKVDRKSPLSYLASIKRLNSVQ